MTAYKLAETLGLILKVEEIALIVRFDMLHTNNPISIMSWLHLYLTVCQLRAVHEGRVDYGLWLCHPGLYADHVELGEMLRALESLCLETPML